MKSIWFVALLGCGDSKPADPAQPPPVSDRAYAADIENLCDVVARSGAKGASAPTYVTATWLGSHLTTQDSRKFLARIQPLGREPKAAALEAEARRVGLTGCALADDWRNAPTPANPHQ
jgi:hypothetical protein